MCCVASKLCATIFWVVSKLCATWTHVTTPPTPTTPPHPPLSCVASKLCGTMCCVASSCVQLERMVFYTPAPPTPVCKCANMCASKCDVFKQMCYWTTVPGPVSQPAKKTNIALESRPSQVVSQTCFMVVWLRKLSFGWTIWRSSSNDLPECLGTLLPKRVGVARTERHILQVRLSMSFTLKHYKTQKTMETF